jgi:hypothetical protein
MLVCGNCSNDIGFVGAVQRVIGDETETRISAGTAARCHICQQPVDVKTSTTGKTLVPHYAPQSRKICPGSGKPVAVASKAPAPPQLAGKYTRDVIKVVSCTRTGDAKIEVLTLEYLDKSERVRIQIEALRDMLGHDFQMRDYPPALNKPHLATWVGADFCVAAARHEHGGFRSIADAEIAAVLADLKEHCHAFFS